MNGISRRSFLKGAAASAMGVAALGMMGAVSATDGAVAAESRFDNAAMDEYIIAEFLKIAEIPRPSSYTDQISAYLAQWGTDHGFESVQDEVGNVIMEIPATAGYESAPLTVLQAHMDMVVVSDDPNFDRLTQGITVIQTDDGYITADGTSMGGDDGIGIATAMFCATSEDVIHGPLRIIITINEEGGSPSGVGNLDHATVMDAAYLINIDSEDYGTCTVAACGFAGWSFQFPAIWEAPAEDVQAYAIELSGCKGGHSGVDIHKNRANAIKAVNYCLAWAQYNGIALQLASFTGGTYGNAIPAMAKAVFVMDPADYEAFSALMDKTIGIFTEQFIDYEPDIVFTYGEADMPDQVLDVESTDKLISIVAATEDGVNTVSQRYENITETSFNLGTLSVEAGAETIGVRVSMRTSAAWPTIVANMQAVAIAKAYGIELSVSDDVYVGWVEKKGDVLPELYAKAFKAHTGDDCLITAVHGGLECGDFADWNPDLNIISVGPTVIGPHSTSECIPVDTIGKTAGAIATVLEYIATGVTVD